jgi:HSP20 family molecular chaperone IbpA
MDFMSCIISEHELTCYPELTKEEEAAARAKEAEEQATLPYKWAQSIGDLDITVEVPGNLKGKDFVVEIKKKKLILGIKGQEPIISVCLLKNFRLGSLETDGWTG